MDKKDIIVTTEIVATSTPSELALEKGKDKFTALPSVARDGDSKTCRLIDAENDIQALQQWLAMRGKRSHATYTNYLKEGRRIILWAAWNRKHLCDLMHADITQYERFLYNPEPRSLWCGNRTPATPESVDRFMAELMGRPYDESVEVTWRPFVAPLSSASVQQSFAAIGSLFKYLHSTGYLGKNPLYAYMTEAPRQDRKSVERYLGDEALAQVMKYIDGMTKTEGEDPAYCAQVRWIFTLGFYAGARRAEIANARMCDIYRTQRGNWEWRIFGKRKKVREVPLSEEIMSELSKLRTSLGMPPRPGKDDLSPLVPKVRGEGQMTGDRIYKIVKEVCGRVASEVKASDPDTSELIESVSTHWLRHTCATIRANSGTDLRYVQELLGHEDLNTTRRYAHADRKKFEEITTALQIHKNPA